MIKIENERTAEKRVTSTQDYNIKRRPSHGSGQWNNYQNSSYQTNSYHGQDNQNIERLFDRRSDQFPTRNDGNRSNNRNLKVELGEIMEIFLVRHLDKDATFLKVTLSVDLNPFNLEIHHLEDQMVTRPLVPLLRNKNFRKATIKHQRTLFVSPPRMITLTNYQNFVR